MGDFGEEPLGEAGVPEEEEEEEEEEDVAAAGVVRETEEAETLEDPRLDKGKTIMEKRRWSFFMGLLALSVVRDAELPPILELGDKKARGLASDILALFDIFLSAESPLRLVAGLLPRNSTWRFPKLTLLDKPGGA